MNPIIMPIGGKTPRIAESAYIAPTATVIGDAEIGEEASIWFGCILRADGNLVRVGARSNIQDGTVIHTNGRNDGTLIGADVTVGHMVMLHGCILEDRAFVGMGAMVMDDAVVESGGMVAAGALVPPRKRIPAGELWGGRPASFLREIDVDQATSMAYATDHYVELMRAYRDA